MQCEFEVTAFDSETGFEIETICGQATHEILFRVAPGYPVEKTFACANCAAAHVGHPFTKVREIEKPYNPGSHDWNAIDETSQRNGERERLLKSERAERVEQLAVAAEMLGVDEDGKLEPEFSLFELVD